ncbi:hypothetical protein Sipo8835_34590 [Streptomyces ipomoeae]|jgi:hypothetical protein|uniref:Toxin-antitoxin system, toxin component, RelE family n=2 Tax=Streptomyces ipomoeae TaxID=103232 RepID=L1KL41_9ACTN|nr:hypothetical protein [Streptomyces ipomoeae]EKX61292.1 hypothetical protein STRIP9103_02318 [Streptomyces ipomoeae 91-03]MDX2697539.1 hypothetical protein [Streptomyces ipomoeae]MDX2825028.1 hypothetical protein [Streptomyces ipomoeae]MDX2843348.1 hypothetical protein [Streptomyces ipomoeae]MDX2877593.1 hypothetical protein [Streptomyces ipomoeae]
MAVFNVIFSEAAARVRDSLPDDHLDVLQEGLVILAKDPRTKISAAISGDENTRSVALSRNVAIEYVISDGLLIVLVVHIVDTSHVLVENKD